VSLAANMALATVGGTLAMTANVIDSQGLLVYRAGDTSVKAYSRRCTHEGCTTGAFSSGISTCPCHGSQYDTSGNVVTGPAPHPLPQYTAVISGNIITITA
jgi:cytochrome b6-f complex iron-sulfur subunit